ncbi:MAG: ABC transporter permease subunit [Streptosporangiales bacterium]|nr:ABC transporter permease subunit [Streptosporangiales bacterium]
MSTRAADPAGDERTAPARRRGVSRWRWPLVSAVSAVGFVVVWAAVTSSGVVPSLFLPSPQRVVTAGVELLGNGALLADIGASMRRVLVGFVAAAVVGVPAGALLAQSRWAKAVFDPLLSLIRPLPSMAWIPLTLLWLGITEAQKYTIVFMGTVAPLTLAMYAAASSIDPVLVKAARNLGASKLAVLRLVVLPGSLPHILSGLRVMLGVSWTCVISAELVAADKGLGFLIMNAREYFRTDQVLVGMVLISMVVLATDLVLNLVERRLLRWRE